MKKRFLIISLLLSFWIMVNMLGCGKGPEDYIPLKSMQGATYEYILQYKYNGKEVTSKLSSTLLLPRELEGKEVVPVRQTYKSGKSVLYFFSIDSNGIGVTAVQRAGEVELKTYDSPKYLLKDPVNPGTTWEYKMKTVRLGIKYPVTQKVTIESTDEIVTVQARNFQKCIKKKIEGSIILDEKSIGKIEKYIWYAPGVGCVRSVYKEFKNGKVIYEFSEELVSIKK